MFSLMLTLAILMSAAFLLVNLMQATVLDGTRGLIDPEFVNNGEDMLQAPFFIFASYFVVLLHL